MEACEASLRRLGTDYVDAYYLHWPNHDIPIAESLEGLVGLKAAGKIRAAGICNFGPIDLADLKAAKDADVVVLHQLPYSLFWRAIEYDILPATRALGLDVVAYSVLAQGLLTGRYSSSAEVPQSLHATRFYGDGPHGDPGADTEVFAALPGLRALADEAGVPLADLAIQWALAQPGVAVVLTGARTPAEIEANAKALDVRVDPAVLAAATALSEPVKAKLGPNPDMWMAGEKSRFR
jgi:aryl-alcohol dehydrogenase-like predicted oxidoreductase